jgi:hypothetical protein
MPTPDQIEAMARAIHAEDASYLLPYDMLQYNAQGLRERQARAAIDACEATRPAVPSDEELLAIYDQAHDDAFVANAVAHSGLNDAEARSYLDPRDYHRTYDLAGIRAVRERIEGSGHE